MKKVSGSVSSKAIIIGLVAIVVVLSVLLSLSVAQQSSKKIPSVQSFTSIWWNNDSPQRIKADKGIATLGAGQYIENGIVTDPTNPDIVYFSTSTSLPAGKPQTSTLVSIYKYNLKTLEFERIYKKEYAPGTFPGLTKDIGNKAEGVTHFILPRVSVVGYDNGKLALFVMDTDDSPGPCWTPLASGHEAGPTRATVSLDLNNPSSGFAPYIFPDNALAQGEAEYQKCMIENFPS